MGRNAVKYYLLNIRRLLYTFILHSSRQYKLVSINYKNYIKIRDSEMAQCVKALSAKPDDLS